jgi:NADH pyrophosphatase zinc ribbon domain
MSTLREKFLALLGEPDERPSSNAILAPPPSTPADLKALVVENPRAAVAGSCSRCGSNLFIDIGGAGRRCQQCGHQVVNPVAKGISRADIENYDGGRAVMNPPPFFRAMARLRILR